MCLMCPMPVQVRVVYPNIVQSLIQKLNWNAKCFHGPSLSHILIEVVFKHSGELVQHT